MSPPGRPRGEYRSAKCEGTPVSGAGEARARRARRAALAIVGCALLAPIAAFAQDPRAAMVQNVAREWLKLIDTPDAAASWKAAGERFRQAITLARWTEAVTRERGRRGPVAQRAVAATSFRSSVPGLPDGGNYALVQFRTSFANEAAGTEQVTLEAGTDSVWRVVGYVIR
jgi:hypothetical protein